MTFLAVLISSFVFLFVEIGVPLLASAVLASGSTILGIILFIISTALGALADAVIIERMTRKNGERAKASKITCIVLCLTSVMNMISHPENIPLCVLWIMGGIAIWAAGTMIKKDTKEPK